ncbi:MAG: T9SS type A sorting domain-containing protein [Ignavibacteriaceae bacterium]|nr:T9SS type A sorting domain-containing protein [Ignavibacteriaceae bacterium]
MKIFLSIFILTLCCIPSFAQSPASASNPMTAPGAIGVALDGHILVWSNPLNVDYNDVYFSTDSSLVANLNPSVKIYNGYPSTVFNTASLNIYGSLSYNTKYFWRIVEHNTFGSTPSPVWYFKSRSPSAFGYDYFFTTGLEGWEIIGPNGFNNWYWQNSSFAGGVQGEVVFNWTPLFIGESYLMSPEIPAAANSFLLINFRYYEDWWSDTVVVGCAYTTDNGNSWTSIWELHATGNVGPEMFFTDLYIPGNFRLGFYYLGDSNNIDFLYVDDIGIYTAITVPQPPSFLQAMADTTELKVEVQWNGGSAPGPISGYQLQRKNGLPTETGDYITIVTTNSSTFYYEDLNVELNNNYTYRICTIYGASPSCYGNEATAYVPPIVPVELVSFTGSVEGNDVILTWNTATEVNNQGFEVQRKTSGEYERVGFVEGKGTTTEVQNYLFRDKDLLSGAYTYRLKQMDYDGSFAYSDEVEIEIEQPSVFYLGQNYPNPFNPSTNIKYSIPADGVVTLKVYDILGKEVSTLVNEYQQAGTFEVVFDGSNLASGVYYYQLITGELNATKKLMLTK